MRHLSTFCLTILLTFASNAMAGDRVIARVGGEAVTAMELEAALQQNPSLDRERALDLLIERRLVLNWAREKGITVSDAEVDKAQDSIRQRNSMSEAEFEETLHSEGQDLKSFRFGIREQLTINKALGSALALKTQVSQEELEDLYREMYPRTPTYDVSHILLRVDDDSVPGNEAVVKQEAQRLLSMIREGDSFQSLAEKFSQDPSSADQGGRLGIFREGELLPELQSVVATLDPGEAGGPVRTSAGYHVLLLNSKGYTEPPPLEEVRPTLERTLMARKEESARNEWLEELRKTTYIEILPDEG